MASNLATRPNYFLGLKISNQEIINQLIGIQNQIVTQYSSLNRSKIQSEKFHLTAFVMTLDESKGEVDKVKGLLPQINDILNDIYKTPQIPVSVNVKGVGSFNDRVIWAGLNQDQQTESLTNFVKNISKLFINNNIPIDERFSPHITLFKGKFTADFKSAVSYCTLNGLPEKEFGIQLFQTLDLMKIGSTDKTSKYYTVLDQLLL